MSEALDDTVGVAVVRVLAEHQQQALPRHEGCGAAVGRRVHHVMTLCLFNITFIPTLVQNKLDRTKQQ